MGNKHFKFMGPVFWLALALEAASCSLVREGREDCPCELTVEIRDLPSYPVSLSLSGDGFREQMEVSRDTALWYACPSPGVQLLASRGVLLHGQQRPHSPGIRLSAPCTCTRNGWKRRRDSARVKVRLQKHFCTLSLLLDGPPGNGAPILADVRGCVEGLTLDGEPLKGSFSCRMAPGESIRLPRQTPEEELWLDIRMPEGVVRSFALGNYMLDAGFDWTAPSLEDLSLEVNLSVTHLTFQTGNWSTAIPFKVEI